MNFSNGAYSRRTLYLGQKGKHTRFLEGAKGSFAESRGQTPGSLASGSRHREPWRLALESEKGFCLSGETNFVEACTPSFDPKAQHINRGVGLAPKNTSRYTKPCAGNPDPLVYPPSSFCSAWRSPAEIVLNQQRHHTVVLPELIYYFAHLAGSRRRGRHRVERVLNTEVP